MADAPRLVAAHALVRSWPQRWHLDERRPPRDVLRLLVPGRRVAAFDGTLLTVADRFDFVAVALRPDGTAAMVGPGWASGSKITGVRLRGEWLYSSTAGDSGGDVWRLGEDGATFAGVHDLESWVDRAAYAGPTSARPGPWGIEVARATP